MYSYFEGKLIEKTPAYVVIDCNGIGYILNITLNTYTAIKDKERCKLFAHLVVREDAHILYGFAAYQELDLFRKLISVSGVGPGTARMVLSSVAAEEVIDSIVKGDVTALQAVKGIGAKTAQRIIVDLKDKLAKSDLSKDFFVTKDNTKRQEALTALVMLGFSKANAEKALEKILKSADDSVSVEQLIKQSLQIL